MKGNIKKINEVRNIGNLVYRVRLPEGKGQFPIILLLHGWTGNEESMWIFSHRMPDKSILIAPRGIYPSQIGGYAWVESNTNEWSKVTDFKPAIGDILQILDTFKNDNGFSSNISILGFSQGAALGYAMLILRPDIINAVGVLSGFLPADFDKYVKNDLLLGKKVFIAHGTKDQFVPVNKARESIAVLQESGANVIYCEDDVGHKLSTHCFRGLQKFFLEKLEQ